MYKISRMFYGLSVVFREILSCTQPTFIDSFIRVNLYREAKKRFRLEYILGGSSFSGERSCAHNVQEVGSQTPRRVVVRLSMCSNICSL
jgi:hypothetical protein